ncbi:hypothetical protein MMPV_002917 [Pyropia vietnamensis]
MDFRRFALWPAAVAVAAAAAVVAAVATRVAGFPVPRRSGSHGFATGFSPAAAAAAKATATLAPAGLTPAVIPFPSPPPGVPLVGRFNAPPSLQCRLHPGAAGGASPDPDAVAAPAGASHGTGWVLQANASSAPIFIPYAPGTCASPLEDARQFEALSAPAELARTWLKPVESVALPSTGNVDAEFVWEGNAFYAEASTMAIRRGLVGTDIRSEWFRPQPCGEAAGNPLPGLAGLVCEADLTRMLTLQRNHWYSLLRRERGVFDVLAVTRITSGVALDGKAHVVAALDALSAWGGPRSGARVSVVTYTTRDGVIRPVLVGETALLSLGRGVFADPSWLGGATFPRGPAARVVLDRMPGKNKLTWSLWDPAGMPTSSTNSSQWLQRLASVLCRPPASSFVLDLTLCDGVEPPRPSGRGTALAGGRRVADTVGVGAGHFVGFTQDVVWWVLKPRPGPPTAPPCPAAFDNLDGSMAPWQPIWLLGRGSRELHTALPGGEAEAHLAARISSCTSSRTRPELLGRVRMTWDVGVMTTDLSQRYRRDLFRKDPPADPVSNVQVLLAALVVLPEAAAALLLLIQLWGRRTPLRHWYGREGLSYALVLITGAAVLIGISYLDKQEHAGHAWRAATVRLDTRLSVNKTEEEFEDRDPYRYGGRIVTYGETLFLLARTGYRPQQTRSLLIGSVTMYAALTVLVIVQALVQGFRPRLHSEPAAEQRPREEEGGGVMGKGRKGGRSGEDGEGGGGDDLPAASPGPLLAVSPMGHLGRAFALSRRRHLLRRLVAGT